MSYSNHQPQVWVSQDAILPDICIGCGMYTDLRATKKFSAKVETEVAVEAPSESTGLGCLLMLLGPLGMLISLVMNMRNNKAGIKTKTKTITLKTKARIPICPLCQSESKGEPKDADFASGLISFDTNNNFLKQYEALNP